MKHHIFIIISRKNQTWLIKMGLLSFVLLNLLVPSAALALVPNDPLFDHWAYTDIKAPQAWDYTTGSRNVIVAVLDNGLDHLHPDLLDNVWKNTKEIPFNSIDDDHNGYVDDVWGWNFDVKDKNNNGRVDDDERSGNNDPQPDVSVFQAGDEAGRVVHHGTFVAGLIGAVGNNRLLGTGVSWQVKLMNVKVVGNTGSGEPAQLSRALKYAVDNGAHIINISMVSNNDTGMREAVQYAYDHGVVVVAAAGNNSLLLNQSPQYPVCADAGSAKPMVLGVSAIDRSHRSARFSNVGSNCIDITAPGVDMAGLLRYAPSHGLTEQFARGWNGTSFAAPLVSGAAALIKAIQPAWGPDEIYTALLSTVHKTPTADEAEYANLYGKGLLQVDAAVQYALAQPIRTPPLPLRTRSALVSWHPASGLIGVYTIGELPRVSFEQPAVKGISGLGVYERAGRMHYVTVRQSGVNSTVTIYSEIWEAERSWTVPIQGPLGLQVGNILDDDMPEVVVAPLVAGKERWRMYALDGHELRRLDGEQTHAGVGLGLAPGYKENVYEILAVFKDAGVVALHHYDANGTLVKRVDLPWYSRVATPRAGDINGDTARDYMVVGGKGEAPLVGYIQADGTIDRVFPEGNLQMDGGGLSATIADYDEDGKDDVLIAERENDNRVRAWNFESRKIGEWQPFVAMGATGMEILSVY